MAIVVMRACRGGGGGGFERRVRVLRQLDRISFFVFNV